MLKPDNKIFQAYSYINNGNIESFKDLINENPKLLFFRNQNLENLFLYAVKKDKVQFIEYLLLKDQSLIESTNKKSENAIMIASKNISINSLDFLIFKQDIINLLTNIDENLINGYSFVYKYGKHEHVIKTMELLKKNKIKEKIDYNQQNSLHFLSYNNNLNSVENILKIYPEDFVFNKNLDSELNPIMIAAANQNLKNFKSFYRNKNETNSLNYTLLDFSSKNIDHLVFEFLYKKHPKDISKNLIDRVIQDNNDKILNIILNNETLDSNQLDEITKKSNLFINSVKTILNKNLDVNISNIFLNTNKEDIKNIFKNHQDKIRQYLFQNIQKTLINKKDFINKIIFMFDCIDGELSEKESLKFLTQIKKIPTNQQIFLLSKNSIVDKLSNAYKNKIYDLILFRIDKDEPIKNIDTTILPLYMHGNEKNHNICEKIYLKTNRKIVFCDLLAKKIKSFEELKNHKYLDNLELKYIKKILVSNQLTEPSINNEPDIPYSIIKSSLEKSCVESKSIINENIINQAINKNITINSDYWINLFSSELKISQNLWKIFSIPKKGSSMDRIIQSDSKLNESQYFNIIEFTNNNEEFSVKLILNILQNKKLEYLERIKVKTFTKLTQQQIIETIITNHPYELNIGQFLRNNFSIEDLNSTFINNNNLEYLNEFNEKINIELIKKIDFEFVEPFSTKSTNAITSIYNKMEKKEDINTLTNMILDKSNYLTYTIISSFNEEIFEKIDKKTKLKIIQNIFKSNLFSTEKEDNKIINLLINENDLDINKNILQNYKNLSDDKKIKINFLELEKNILKNDDKIKKKIKI